MRSCQQVDAITPEPIQPLHDGVTLLVNFSRPQQRPVPDFVELLILAVNRVDHHSPGDQLHDVWIEGQVRFREQRRRFVHGSETEALSLLNDAPREVEVDNRLVQIREPRDRFAG